MFPADSFPAAYCEERAAADEVKHIARQQQEAFKKTQASASQAQSAQPATPQNLTQAYLQRPPLTRPNSVLGNIFQGFVRAASTSPASSQAATPTTGDVKGARGVNPTSLTAEMEKLRAEQSRDTDIVCCLRISLGQHQN
ncbi:hypothetical protein LTR36_004386 [Oleoguttula mirabilis]|uniref:Uncharacterized protein n=1 Tax=Oleoguttula mirabilis TaxID=1507867 RepID=A0AAV9JGT6_9PEZI|nr:hypothetical protein LTR36_004386 [Oleoguttula mirabilis]